jgi:hypothetical protein
MRPSEEADPKGLELAKRQGDALGQTLKHMTGDVAEDGREAPAGEYLVGYAVEEAEGLYRLKDGRLQWEESGEENAHIEVSVRDAADGRFVPALTVHATLIDDQGDEIGTHHQEFLWHPYLYHYGRNWKVPGDGEYTLRVRIERPDFPRHDKVNGRRYTEPVEAEFQHVRIKTGRK